MFLQAIKQDPYQGSAYFTRFLVISGFLVFPCIFLGLFFFLKETNKSRDVLFTFSSLKQFSPYNYILHNFMFAFMLIAIVCNTFIFFYIVVDIYIIELDAIYEYLWAAAPVEEETFVGKAKFFGTIVFTGFIVHTVTFWVYTYYNLYKTNSYFGEAGREFIRKNMNHDFLKKFEKRSPRGYSGFHHLFLNVPEVDFDQDQRRTVILD